MRLEVLETGGTINGIIDPDAPPPENSRVVAWLRQHGWRWSLELSAELVVMKDSRHLGEPDRRALRQAIEASPVEHILIPHGTFTMPETGVYLRRHLGVAAQGKTIVLVGSLIPLDEPGSDAPSALEFALDTLCAQGPGVWIAMSSRVWNPGEVVKDLLTGEYKAR
jgi:L-asparaginase